MPRKQIYKQIADLFMDLSRLEDGEPLIHSNENLMDVQEVSAFLNLSKSKIYEMCNKDPARIPHVRLDNTIRFVRSDLVKWVEKQKRVALSPGGKITMEDLGL